MRTLLRRRTCDQIIEDVKVALAGWRAGYATTLEVIVEGLDTAYPPTFRELELGVLAKMRGIGIEERAGVTERLQDKLGGRDLVAELRALLPRLADAELEKRLDGQSTILGLATTRLTTVYKKRKSCEPTLRLPMQGYRADPKEYLSMIRPLADARSISDTHAFCHGSGRSPHCGETPYKGSAGPCLSESGSRHDKTHLRHRRGRNLRTRGLGRQNYGKHVREDDRLVLLRPSHVVVGIVGELEDVGREADFVGRGIAVLGRILVEDRVGITGNILVRVYCDESIGADVSVDVVCHEPFSDAGDDDVLRDGRERCKVRNGLKLLEQRGLSVSHDESELQHRGAPPQW